MPSLPCLPPPVAVRVYLVLLLAAADDARGRAQMTFSEADYNAVVDRMLPVLIAFARNRQLSQQDAEEIANDALSALAREWPRLKPPYDNWLFRVATNACISKFRHRKSHRADLHDSISSLEDPPRDEAERRSSWPKELSVAPPEPTEEESLEEFLSSASLSPDERNIFLLVDVEGKSCREAAAILGWSWVKARVTLHRARTKVNKAARCRLREALE